MGGPVLSQSVVQLPGATTSSPSPIGLATMVSKPVNIKAWCEMQLNFDILRGRGRCGASAQACTQNHTQNQERVVCCNNAWCGAVQELCEGGELEKSLGKSHYSERTVRYLEIFLCFLLFRCRQMRNMLPDGPVGA